MKSGWPVNPFQTKAAQWKHRSWWQPGLLWLLLWSLFRNVIMCAVKVTQWGKKQVKFFVATSHFGSIWYFSFVTTQCWCSGYPYTWKQPGYGQENITVWPLKSSKIMWMWCAKFGTNINVGHLWQLVFFDREPKTSCQFPFTSPLPFFFFFLFLIFVRGRTIKSLSVSFKSQLPLTAQLGKGSDPSFPPLTANCLQPTAGNSALRGEVYSSHSHSPSLSLPMIFFHSFSLICLQGSSFHLDLSAS